MKTPDIRYQLQAGPYCFVPDPWRKDVFRAPGGMKLSEAQIRQFAMHQKWEIEKIQMVIEHDDDLENA